MRVTGIQALEPLSSACQGARQQKTGSEVQVEFSLRHFNMGFRHPNQWLDPLFHNASPTGKLLDLYLARWNQSSIQGIFVEKSPHQGKILLICCCLSTPSDYGLNGSYTDTPLCSSIILPGMHTFPLQIYSLPCCFVVFPLSILNILCCFSGTQLSCPLSLKGMLLPLWH